MGDREPVTYAQSGVNLEAADAVVENLRALVESTWQDPNIIPGFSGFLTAYRIGDQVLVVHKDGVGTKLLIALMMGQNGTIGQDLVAMSANDVARVGARVFGFLDYFATGKLDEGVHDEIISGIARACRANGIALMGGETAEMHGLYDKGHYDLSGTALGLIREDQVLKEKYVKPGARLLGWESSGVHSNGLTLVRKIGFDVLGLDVHDYVPELGKTFGEEVLTPTIVYCGVVNDLLETFPGQIKSMAHITGGGMDGNLPRALPEGLGAVVEEGSWPVHPIFGYLQEKGPVTLDEMRRVFNRGIGMISVVNDAGAVPDLIARIGEQHGLKAYDIGEVVEGQGVQYAGG